MTFIGNSASGSTYGSDGGAMYNDGEDGSSSPTLTNVTFIGNSAEDDGGAMYNNATNSGPSNPRLTNVTFRNNTAGWGGAMFSWAYTGRSNPPSIHIGYSIVEGGWDGSGICNNNSTVYDDGGNIDDDPLFVDAASGDVHPQSTSPAIDAGDNSAVPVDVTTDLDGNPRFVDYPPEGGTGSGTSPFVDMGAYEMQTDVFVYLPPLLKE